MNRHHFRDRYKVVQKWSLWKEKLSKGHLSKVQRSASERCLLYMQVAAVSIESGQ